MGYYDTEAPRYDETRGGAERAQAAAAAVGDLVPARGTLLDVGGGTGIVSVELARLGFDVVVADPSYGMVALAAGRLPGRVVRTDGARLPVRDASVDAVTCVWLLHLLPQDVADVVVAEAARVLRPGGRLVTTVDKDLAHGHERRTFSDHRPRLDAVTAALGLLPAGDTTFSGRSAWASATDGDPVFALVGYRKG